MPTPLVKPVLDLFESLVVRPGGGPTRVDRAIARGLLHLFMGQTKLRGDLIPVLGACLDNDSLRQEIVPLLPELDLLALSLVPELRRRADEGRIWAVDLLAGLNDPHPLVLDEAERRFETLMSWSPQPDRPQWNITTQVDWAGIYARFLPDPKQVSAARQLMSIAEDESDLEMNRAQALASLEAVARILRTDARRELFARALAMADPANRLSTMDQFARASLDPFSRTRLDLSPGILSATALRLSAALAVDPEQIDQVEIEVLGSLASPNDDFLHAGAVAAALIGAKTTRLKPDLLARHSSPFVRQAAVVLWSQAVSPDPKLAEVFLNDEERSVRLTLAGAVTHIASTTPRLAVRIRESLARDPSAKVRWRLELRAAADELDYAIEPNVETNRSQRLSDLITAREHRDLSDAEHIEFENLLEEYGDSIRDDSVKELASSLGITVGEARQRADEWIAHVQKRRGKKGRSRTRTK